MVEGGARELNSRLPLAVKVRGGVTSGRKAATSGRLSRAAVLGGARSRQIAAEFRAQRPSRSEKPNDVNEGDDEPSSK
jgi:hypothetical protein